MLDVSMINENINSNLFLGLQILYFLFLISVAIKIIYDTNSSEKAAAYIFLIFLLPLIGVIIYFMFGLNYRKSSLYNKKLILDELQQHKVDDLVQKYKSKSLSKFSEDFPKYSGLATMLLSNKKSLITNKNELKVLINGEEKFHELLQALKNAKDHIHIEYYIFEDDDIGCQIADVLIKKALEGVKVRFIYDDFGSRKIRKKLVPKMREAGVDAYAFYKIIFIRLANRINYRNHRKIVIIDGHTAFVGGINVSDKYINYPNDELFWRDTHLKIEGQGVWDLQKIFLADWNYCSKQELRPQPNFFKEFNTIESNKWMQIVAGGPDSKNPTILYSLIEAISCAKKQVLITTPYLIPGEEFLHALHIAVLRGVEVKIIVPEISDSWVVNAVSKSYFEDLLSNSIEIYQYTKGFIHAKTMVCDNDLSIIGTANLDYRSFNLNFEVNSIVYDQEIALEMINNFNKDLSESKKIYIDEWRERNKFIQFVEKLLRLVAPLL